MLATDIIASKRDCHKLTADEISWMINGITSGDVPDYQTAAWLMAIRLNGMDPVETQLLTIAMRDSGRCADLRDLPGGPALDKHSTGGVGDKTSLVVAPILAACGVPMLKMSGRGLGISGGTIDKLESIPGLCLDIPLHQAEQQVRSIGLAIVSQSKEMAPADGILYALRDVTATVDSIPLIAASIMSKKLAGGSGCIVLDVKCGSGAFMPDLNSARKLSQLMVQIGASQNVPTSAVITNMDAPLGLSVGNIVEVREAIAFLMNAPNQSSRFVEFCIILCGHALAFSGRVNSQLEGENRAREVLKNGLAAQKFEQMIEAQGGVNGLENVLASIPLTALEVPVLANRSGRLAGLHAGKIGNLSVQMGAGRARKSDSVDHGVGVILYKEVGDIVQNGEKLASLYLSSSIRSIEFTELFLEAVSIQDIDEAFETTPLIREWIS